MIIRNVTKKSIIAQKAKYAITFKDRLLGLLIRQNTKVLVFKTRFGIHTFGMQYSIDILILDRLHRVVKIKKTTKPSRDTKSKKLPAKTKSSPNLGQKMQTFLSNVRATPAKPVSRTKPQSKKTTVKTVASKETKRATVVPSAIEKRRGFSLDRKIVLPLIGLLAIALIAYGASRYLVIAWVDKKNQSQDLNSIHFWKKRYGKDLREQLIVQKLVESEADKRHVSVSDAEVNAEIAKIETEQGGASQLDQVLQTQGIDRKDLHSLVKLQLLRDKMFGGDSTVTEDDINKYMEQNKANLPQIDPSNASQTAQIRQSIQNQLKQQKVTSNFNTWLQQTLNSNRVIRL